MFFVKLFLGLLSLVYLKNLNHYGRFAYSRLLQFCFGTILVYHTIFNYEGN